MNGKHLLLVEDDPEIRSLLAALLQREGFSVDTADGGVAMDERLGQRMPDLVVLDLMLPGEDGLSLSKGEDEEDRLCFAIGVWPTRPCRLKITKSIEK